MQLWRCIAEHLAQAEPEVLMLVHPLDMRLESRSQKDRIVRGKQPGLSDVMTGVTAHRKHKLHARQTLESLMSSGLTTPQFSGRVGEACCDDEVHSQVSLAWFLLTQHQLVLPHQHPLVEHMCCSFGVS